MRKAKRGPARPRQIAYSPPVQRLVDEHTWIKRLLALLPEMLAEIRASAEVDEAQALEILDFIRGYADRFHHMKEEEILFDYTDPEAEIIRVIREDHERGRGFVRTAARALEEGKPSTLCANLIAYRDLLAEHIQKEDEILYPYLDRGLTTSQVGEIFRRFDETESRLGDGVASKYERFILNLERHYQTREKEAV